MLHKTWRNYHNLGFIFFFSSAEVLPLVEFELEESIDDDEALQLIKTQPAEEVIATNQQDFELYDHQPQTQQSPDPFAAYLYSQQIQDKSATITLNRDALIRLKPTEVIVCRWPPPLPCRYYRNFMPEVALKHCKHCNKVSFRFFIFKIQI